MRRLCRLVTGVGLLATLALGCGSTNEDRVVFRFVGWNNTGLTQKDAVGEANAQVDVFSHCCHLEESGACLPQNFELLAPTVINAVFRNEEAANMRLDSYAVRVNSPFLPQAGRPESPPSGPTTEIIGGRCATGVPCAIDADCASSTGSTGSTGSTATCEHVDTTVTGLLLFDLQAKTIVHQAICGDDGICGTVDDNLQVLNSPVTITVTFFVSDDADRSFEATANYVVSFGDLETCSGTTGA